MIFIGIRSGDGKGQKLKVNGEGQIPVVVHPHPPKDEEITGIPYRAFFKNNSDATDMRVDGSSTNVDFYIEASTEYDRYIKIVSVVIADAGAALNEFGNLSALSNGVKFSWKTNDLGETVLDDGLKSNFDFMRMAVGNPALGGGSTAFLANNVVSTSEAFLPVIDFSYLFGNQYGLRLRKGTKDRIIFTIRDNVSTVDQFDAIAYGLEI
jgi:hypothetical protein